MILLAKKTAEIDRPINEVYNYVINMDNYSSWFPEVIAIESHNTYNHGIEGKEYLETVKDQFGRSQKIIITVVESIRNKRLVTEGEFQPLLPRMTIEFEETNNKKTLVTWSMASRTTSVFTKLTMIPLARFIMKRRASEAMKQLKYLLER